MKNINKLLLAILTLSQAIILAEPTKPQTWREKTAKFYQETSENLSLGYEYLEARYEMAKDDAKEKLEQLNQKFKETKEWVKKNPKKTAAAIATIVVITAIAIKKMRENKPQYKPFPKNIENANSVVLNPGKQEEIISPKAPVFPSAANPVSGSQTTNVVDPNHTYAALLNPDTNGIVTETNETYSDLGFQLQNEIAQRANDQYNNLANTINPKYSDEIY